MLLFLKNLLFTLVFPGTVGAWLPLWFAPDEASPHAALRYLASVPFTIGGAIYAWCVWDFATFGRGTPLPIDAPKKLVVRGLYRFVRNPMYVGVLTFATGWAVYFSSLALAGYVAVVWLAFHSFVVLFEEPSLGRSFGVEYERYREEVRRWLPHCRPAGLRENRGSGP